MAGREKWYVVIVGCGRMGAFLAGRPSLDGHRVVIIDWEEEAFQLLDVGFSGYKARGDATEFAVLKRARLEEADLFVVAATAHDNTNLLVCQVAKEIFKVGRVIARAHDPSRLDFYGRVDVEAVSPAAVHFLVLAWALVIVAGAWPFMGIADLTFTQALFESVSGWSSTSSSWHWAGRPRTTSIRTSIERDLSLWLRPPRARTATFRRKTGARV